MTQGGTHTENPQEAKVSIKGLMVIGGIVFLFVLAVLWINAKPYFDVWEMKKHVSESLVDPRSADFKNIREVGFGYCGEVNAKNRMGGYTGFTKFHAYKSIVDGKWNVDLMEVTVNAVCK